MLVDTFIFSNCVTLLGRSQKIYVDSYPKGASLYANSDYVGTTPCTFKSKMPKLSLSFYKNGYFSETVFTSSYY